MSMGLRLKLYIPLITAGAILLASIHFYILPYFENQERTEHIEHIHAQLATLSVILADTVRNFEFTRVNSLLQDVYRLNPNWHTFEFRNTFDIVIYSHSVNEQEIDPASLLTLEYPILSNGELNASLYVQYDMRHDLLHLRERFVDYQRYIFGFLIVLLLLFSAIVEVAIIRPVRQLRKAAADVASKDYQITLPKAGTDELGELIREFGWMRNAIVEHETEMQLEVADRREAETHISYQYRRQAVISAILKFSLLKLPIDELLQKALSMLLALPKLGLESRGAIFIVEDDGSLLMRAQVRMAPELLAKCHRVSPGQCLCGRAALGVEPMIRTHVDHEHETTFTGMADHGHLLVPIVADSKTLGVINLYLPAQQAVDDVEVGFLQDVAATLAGVLQRMRVENELYEINCKLEYMVQQRTLELQHQKFALDEHSIVAITDRAGMITYVNEKFCELSKYRRHQLVGKDHRLLNSGTHPREFFVEMWRTIGHGKVWKGEICNRASDGSLYWVDSTIVPFLDGNGKPYQYVAIRTDITGRIRQQEMIRAAHEQSLAANRAKDEFLAVMSHEIRTPMNGMIGVIDMLEDTELSSEQQEYLTVARSATMNLLTMLNQTLDYTKMESGRLEFEELAFDPRLFCLDVYNFYLQKASAKELKLDLEQHDVLPDCVLGDPVRIRQVLSNLLDNAIKFTEAGRITLGIRLKTRDDDHCRLCFEVSDNGIGIPVEQQAKIFCAFMQADSSITRQYGGTGLGLAIVEKLVKQLGGQITLSSEVGVGTTFYVELPFALPVSQATTKANDG